MANMKIPLSKPQRKFIVGLSLYALVILILGFMPNYKIACFGMCILNCFTFAMALWSLCLHKRIFAFLLIASLVAAPVAARADEPPPPPDKDAVAIACMVIIVGGIIVYGVWKICKMLPPAPPKTPPPPPPCPCVTNQPPPVPCPCTNAPPPKPHKLFGLQMPDLNQQAVTGYQMNVLAFQSSSDGNQWREDYVVTNWLSDQQLISVIASNGVALQTNITAVNWTNETVYSDFSDVMPQTTSEPQQFWRAVEK